MPPFVAKAATAAGAELELPAKVQELLAGRPPRIILPCNDRRSHLQVSHGGW